jgi:hypothetical protein
MQSRFCGHLFALRIKLSKEYNILVLEQLAKLTPANWPKNAVMVSLATMK